MIVDLAVEDVCFLVGLVAIAVGCRVALRIADATQAPPVERANRTPTLKRGRSW